MYPALLLVKKDFSTFNLRCMLNLKQNLRCTLITDNLEEIIQNQIYKDYDKSDPNFPVGVCPPCKTRLYVVKKKGKTAVPASAQESWNLDYQQFGPPSQCSPCDCRICGKVRIRTDFQTDAPVDVPRCHSPSNNNAERSQDQAEAEEVYHCPSHCQSLFDFSLHLCEHEDFVALYRDYTKLCPSVSWFVG